MLSAEFKRAILEKVAAAVALQTVKPLNAKIKQHQFRLAPLQMPQFGFGVAAKGQPVPKNKVTGATPRAASTPGGPQIAQTNGPPRNPDGVGSRGMV